MGNAAKGCFSVWAANSLLPSCLSLREPVFPLLLASMVSWPGKPRHLGFGLIPAPAAGLECKEEACSTCYGLPVVSRAGKQVKGR